MGERLNPPIMRGQPLAVPHDPKRKPRVQNEQNVAGQTKVNVIVRQDGKRHGSGTTFPACIVYLKPQAKSWRSFYRFLQANELGVVVWGDETPGRYSGTKREKVVRMGGPDEVSERAANANHDSTSVTGERHAWEVVGDDALLALIKMPWVSHWHPLIACSVRWSGPGSGSMNNVKVITTHKGAFAVKMKPPPAKEGLNDRGRDTRSYIPDTVKDDEGREVPNVPALTEDGKRLSQWTTRPADKTHGWKNAHAAHANYDHEGSMADDGCPNNDE